MNEILSKFFGFTKWQRKLLKLENQAQVEGQSVQHHSWCSSKNKIVIEVHVTSSGDPFTNTNILFSFTGDDWDLRNVDAFK